MSLQGSSTCVKRTIPLGGLVLMAALLVLSVLFLLNGLDAERIVGKPTQADVTAKLRELANAIKTDDIEAIERLLDWFERWNIKVSLDEMAGRSICMLCERDYGPAGTREDSHGVCDLCLAQQLKELDK